MAGSHPQQFRDPRARLAAKRKGNLTQQCCLLSGTASEGRCASWEPFSKNDAGTVGILTSEAADPDELAHSLWEIFVLPFQRGLFLGLSATGCYLIAHVVGYSCRRCRDSPCSPLFACVC